MISDVGVRLDIRHETEVSHHSIEILLLRSREPHTDMLSDAAMAMCG